MYFSDVLKKYMLSENMYNFLDFLYVFLGRVKKVYAF